MRRYACPDCGKEVYFDNTQCVNCGFALHYASQHDEMTGVPGTQRSCANRTAIGCNWLSDTDAQLCASCALTLTVPDISASHNVERWAQLERAKRLLQYALIKFRLPLSNPSGSEWLRFELLADEPGPPGEARRVTTGHDNGLITINIEEADDAIRERNRTALGEPFRTLVGHFRHEVGHFFWDVLVRDGGRQTRFREVFGDEREDYADALQRHYEQGPPREWQNSFVSAYASSHAWEDFAETWAHYLHMVDGLETAQAHGVLPGATSPPPTPFYRESGFDRLIESWIPLTVAMNAVNRSIGNHDFYPFVLSDAISHKLQFIHDLVHRNQ